MDKNLPLISVITVVFNGIEEIENTILSVIQQTYINIEYIVIDGASTDGTVDIIKQYADKIAYWITEPDKGIYDAMNKGIQVATGKWIIFRNSGDYFSSKNILSDLFNGKDYNQYDIIYGKAMCWDQYGYCIADPPLKLNPKEKGMPVWHPSTFIKTTLHKEIMFDLKYKLAADHDFFIKCIKIQKSFLYTPYVISIFNIGEGASISGQHISAREHFLIHGGNMNDFSQRFRLEFKIIKIHLILFIKKMLPHFIMKLRRKQQKRILWSADYTINSILKENIHQ